MTHCRNLCLVLLLTCLISFLPLKIEASSSSRKSEAEALIEWKGSWSFSRLDGSWSLTNVDNICDWSGISCDSRTGVVSQLDLSNLNITTTLARFNFSSFPGLTKFVLKDNTIQGQIPSDIGVLSNLTVLDLSSNSLIGELPFEIGNLTQLQYLRLSYNMLSGIIPYQLSLLHNLWFLDLEGNNLTTAPWSKFSGMPSLTIINLGLNMLSSGFPVFLSGCRNLKSLDLSYNNFSGPIPNWVFTNLTKLELLELSFNSFQGQLSLKISQLSNLKYVFLANNMLTGSIPEEVGLLSDIQTIQLSQNLFNGNIPSSLGLLDNLRYLDLSFNSLNSTIPSSIFNLSSLVYIDMSSNNLRGTVELTMLSNLRNLSVFDVSYNSLSLRNSVSVKFAMPSIEVLLLSRCNLSDIPTFLQGSRGLRMLDLSENKIQGEVPEWFFEVGKQSLTYLNLSHNYLTSLKQLPWENLEHLFLDFNFLQGPIVFPPFTFILKSFSVSNNSFTGEIPPQICNLTYLTLLDLSVNYLTGRIPQCLGNHEMLRFLSTSRNNLNGVIPSSFGNLHLLDILDLSHNNLSGELPSSICNLRELQILDLSYNNLSGKLTSCLGNDSSNLAMMHLQVNNFQGTIPDELLIKKTSLRGLNLNSNKLEGLLPRSLENCVELVAFDVGNNDIVDVFPWWLGKLTKLEILVLGPNRFHGPIHDVVDFPFSRLRILDFSHNEFTGRLPEKLFGKMEAMMKGNRDGSVRARYMESKTHISGYNSYEKGGGMGLQLKLNQRESSISYQYGTTVSVTVKGFRVELVRILTIYTTFDMSNNRFEGNIPEVVSEFRFLRFLNFSHNRITGQIPPSLGKMSVLESLDLSWNKLQGSIPRTLVSLTFLAVLNLSGNNLTGPIPEGGQFNTFGNESYLGNPGLCGLPLSRKCEPDRDTKSSSNQQDDDEPFLTWKVATIGYACGLAIGLSTGYIVFTTGSPRWLVKLVNATERHIETRKAPRGRRGSNQMRYTETRSRTEG